MEQMVLAAGIMTGGGIAICMGDEGMMVVTWGDDILFLSASSARTACQ